MNFDALSQQWRAWAENLHPQLRAVKTHIPDWLRRGAELGQAGLVLAEPVWAKPERRLSRLAEPIIAVAAALALVAAAFTGLMSLASLVAAVALIFAILSTVFGIHLEPPGTRAS